MILQKTGFYFLLYGLKHLLLPQVPVEQGWDAAATVTGASIGAAIGAVGVFLASIPACEQESHENPSLLCGYSGMTKVGSIAGGAVLGAAIGGVIAIVRPRWRLRYATNPVLGGSVSVAPTRDGFGIRARIVF